MLFSAIKTNIGINLNDASNVSYSASDLSDSVQDAYDDIISQTQCIVKKVTLTWTANLNYYDMITLVSDYLACVAIYNNINNKWLFDDMTLIDLDKIRDDWELAIGTPENWIALNFRYLTVFPKYKTVPGAPAVNTFDLYYWAIAPVAIDTNTPLITGDFQHLLEKFSTADLLEQFEEFSKASNFWEIYMTEIEDYKDRVKNLATRDMLFLI